MKPRIRGLLICVLLASVVLITGCGGVDSTPPTQNERPVVFVSILPMQAFVKAVAGDAVEVRVLVGEGQDPHTYQPTPRQVAALGQAAVLFRIGVPFEDQLIPKLKDAAPQLLIVDAASGIERIHFADSGSFECEHGEHEHADHDHGASAEDPHIWLDPIRAGRIARNMLPSLQKLIPHRSVEMEASLLRWEAEMDALDKELRQLLEPLRGSTVMVYHPAFGYFCHAYGLQQRAVETGGNEPSASELATLMKEASASGIRVIFVQKQFPSGAAAAVAEAIDGRVATLDPLSADYQHNLRAMAQAIVGSSTDD